MSVTSDKAVSTDDVLDPFRLDGRVAVVTGASSGLGNRFARVLRAAGAEVVVAARRADRLQSLADQTGVVPVTCDVRSDEDRQRLVATAIERFGRLDVLVNNAGTGIIGPPEDEPVDAFREQLETNVVALFALAQLAGRQMLEAGRGSIVNVASMFGRVASLAGMASYTTGKGGVASLTLELAAHWAPRGVRVNAIAPGYFPTEATAPVFENDFVHDLIRAKTPMRRAGSPHELDGALLFLVSDASSYVTGHVLAVDGGWTAV